MLIGQKCAIERVALVGTAVFFVIAAVFGAPVFGLLKAGNDFEDPSSQSAKARDQLQRAAGTQVDVGLVALVRLGVPVSRPSATTEVMGIVRTIRADPAVARVVSFYTTHDPALVSRDGASTNVAATFKDLSSTRVENAGKRLQSKLERRSIRAASFGHLHAPASDSERDAVAIRVRDHCAAALTPSRLGPRVGDAR